MATKKKDLLNQDTSGVDIPETIEGSVSGDLSAELPAVIQTDKDTGDTALDLNELLSSMDQQSETDGEALSSENIMVNAAENTTANENESEGETPKPKRTSRKKETTEVSQEQMAAAPKENESDSSYEPSDKTGTEEVEEAEKAEANAPATKSVTARRIPRSRTAEAPVLTIDARSEVETEEEREDIIWHEIHNAYRTRRILTGQLGGVEQTDAGKTIAIVDYKGFRIIIPLKEMMINLGRMPSCQEYADFMLRQNKILGNMLGAEIDFIVMGIDSKSRSVVASRNEAMLKKRQIFYLDTDAAGMYRIYEGRIVQARIIAVAEKVIRVEIFGVECSIMARDLAWDWVGDAHERFNVGDQVLVRILSVRRDNPEDIGVRADIKSVSQNPNQENLKKCRIQSKYAGKVTDVHKGVVYVRLSNGANAVAHSCYDHRTPGKKDDVSFAVTRLDEERGVAVGIITRIIRQNL